MSSPSEPRLWLGGLISEAWRIAFSLPVVTAITVLIVASISGFIVATTGQTVRAEQDVLSRIDEAGTRLVSAIDDQGTGKIPPEAVDRLGSLTSVTWVIGLGYAADGRNSAIGPSGAPVAIRYWWGDLPPEVEINGRHPQPGEALVGSEAQTTLGLDVPIGSVDIGDTQLAIVGGFTAGDALAPLNTSILARPTVEQLARATLRSVHALATTPAQVEPLTSALADLLGAEDSTAIRFETSQTLADVRAAVAGELGQFSRRLVLTALGVGLILVVLVVYSSVTMRRQDFGRRRALGASRGTIVGLVGVQNALVALIGTVFGCIAGGLVVLNLTGGLPDLEFTVAVGVLTVATVVLGTSVPALIAAYRNPVKVLRIP
ncbi:MAG: FtsX-like permease family protein [Acidimicrobiia bacterium]